jgi:hypothetical protein
MTPKDLFGLVVRTGAVLAFGYGAYLLVVTAWEFVTALVFQGLGDYPLSTLVVNLGPGVGWALGGVTVLRFADRVVRFAYRPRPAGSCENCGYDLRGSPARCPECGTTAPAPPA